MKKFSLYTIFNLKSLTNNQISVRVFSGLVEPEFLFSVPTLKQAAVTKSRPNKTWRIELIIYGQNSSETLTSSVVSFSMKMFDSVVEFMLLANNKSSVENVLLICSAQRISLLPLCPRNNRQLKLVVKAPF